MLNEGTSPHTGNNTSCVGKSVHGVVNMPESPGASREIGQLFAAVGFQFALGQLCEYRIKPRHTTYIQSLSNEMHVVKTAILGTRRI